MVYHVFPPKKCNEKELTHERQFILPTSVWFIHGPKMPTFLSGGVFCFHMPYLQAMQMTADQCTWICDDMQLYDNSGSSKDITYCCCPLRTRGIFANGVGALRMPAFLTHTQTSKTRAKRLGSTTDAESTNTPFLTWVIIACYRKLSESLFSHNNELCIGFSCAHNKQQDIAL